MNHIGNFSSSLHRNRTLLCTLFFIHAGKQLEFSLILENYTICLIDLRRKKKMSIKIKNFTIEVLCKLLHQFGFSQKLYVRSLLFVWQTHCVSNCRCSSEAMFIKFKLRPCMVEEFKGKFTALLALSIDGALPLIQ